MRPYVCRLLKNTVDNGDLCRLSIRVLHLHVEVCALRADVNYFAFVVVSYRNGNYLIHAPKINFMARTVYADGPATFIWSN